VGVLIMWDCIRKIEENGWGELELNLKLSNS
jgi:hypothetical protein